MNDFPKVTCNLVSLYLGTTSKIKGLKIQISFSFLVYKIFITACVVGVPRAKLKGHGQASRSFDKQHMYGGLGLASCSAARNRSLPVFFAG